MSQRETQGVTDIANQFAQLSAKAAQAANANRARVATRNVEAGQQQLRLRETDQRRKISNSLQRSLGALATAAAYRGTAGAASTAASQATASVLAAEEAATASANRAAGEAALRAQNQPQFDDPILAAISGGQQGLTLGTRISDRLAAMAEDVNFSRRRVESLGFGGRAIMEDVFAGVEIPGFSVGDLINPDTGEITLDIG